ncbi:hypothetical protein CVIRNUC_000759 [Coccomyxa viridis]|uniref:DUF4281 domain-containing protein n=1 Tax=Coccomyxa viridis TaxID=1274662 RepID=A0AAV1HSR1_9CHLO|nr:hypothetical protein CVIRNUC_000759 [Coccomyxa viridis]
MPVIGLDLSDQQIFDGINAVLPAWILLVVAPRWRVTHWIVNLTAFGFCLLYTGLFATLLLQSETTFDFKEFFTYEGVQQSLATKEVVLPAWVHYVAFDLFTAKWQVQDATASQVPHLLVIPCLLLTLMLGPAGLLSYFLLRTLIGLIRRSDKTVKSE